MLDSTHSLLEHAVKDLYSAEKQLLKALPRMTRTATAPSLKKAFKTHLKETEVHVQRLSDLAEILEMKTGGKRCEAMAGLIAEGRDVMTEDGTDACIDAALIGAAQKVEHYEIASYRTARALAERLGESKAVHLLKATLKEEKATRRKLTRLSTNELLPTISLTGGDAKAKAVPASSTSSRRR